MQLYSPKQVAAAIGVSEASLKRWCDRGLLEVHRTVGGHRRITKQEVLHFVRRSKYDLVAPEILGLSKGRLAHSTGSLPSMASVMDLLVRGDEQTLRVMMTDYYTSGAPLERLFDDVLAPAFHEIGSAWERGDLEVYQERLSGVICMRALVALSNLIRPASSQAELSLGAGLTEDPYQLANIMVEILLRERGWHSQTLGTNLPGETLAKAIETRKPRLFWLSVSAIADEARFRRDCALIWEACRASGCWLAIGGRALTEPVREHIRYTVFCDTLKHLLNFLESH